MPLLSLLIWIPILGGAAALLAGDQSRTRAVAGVTPQAALRIGTEMERLAAAMDGADLVNLKMLAGRLPFIPSSPGKVARLAEIAGRSALSLVRLQQDAGPDVWLVVPRQPTGWPAAGRSVWRSTGPSSTKRRSSTATDERASSSGQKNTHASIGRIGAG